MISAFICTIVFIVSIAFAMDGDWGAFAACILIILFVVISQILDSEVCTAYWERVDYWRKGGPNGPRNVRMMDEKAERRAAEKRKKQLREEEVNAARAYNEALERMKREEEEGVPRQVRERIPFESETLKARYAPMPRSKAYLEAVARKNAENAK